MPACGTVCILVHYTYHNAFSRCLCLLPSSASPPLSCRLTARATNASRAATAFARRTSLPPSCPALPTRAAATFLSLCCTLRLLPLPYPLRCCLSLPAPYTMPALAYTIAWPTHSFLFLIYRLATSRRSTTSYHNITWAHYTSYLARHSGTANMPHLSAPHPSANAALPGRTSRNHAPQRACCRTARMRAASLPRALRASAGPFGGKAASPAAATCFSRRTGRRCRLTP